MNIQSAAHRNIAEQPAHTVLTVKKRLKHKRVCQNMYIMQISVNPSKILSINTRGRKAVKIPEYQA